MAAGIATPSARRAALRTLAFDWIGGPSGRELLALETGTWCASLRDLHRLPPAPSLRPFDPLMRIRPRLRLASAEVAAFITALPVPTPAPVSTIHGDFHPGQVIVSEGSAVLIDLDDLSAGVPEADFGNLVAYLSTLPGTLTHADALSGWTAVFHAWLDGEMDVETLSAYRNLAFARRALKLAERGDRSVLDALPVILGSIQTSPSDIA